MNLKPSLTILFLVAVVGCNAESTNNNKINSTLDVEKHNNTTPTQQKSISIDDSLKRFSETLNQKDPSKFISLANPQGINLVRIFTSGNLGSRGAPLSQTINPTTVTNEITFSVEGQTAFNVPAMFPSLPISSFQEVVHQKLQMPSNIPAYDQWTPILINSLKNTPEIENGAPIILASDKGDYWVFADAQIIDDILVGGFAIFTIHNNTLKLTAIIELL